MDLDHSGKLLVGINFVFKDFLFIYLTERDTAREGAQAGGVGEGEAGSLDAGLDPRTPGL